MATTIKLKNGSGAPAASDLVQGEPAIDLTNKRLYTEDSGGSVIEVGTNPSSLSINGTAVTATAAEINTLDGITSSTAELNILDGVTSTAAELNILDGVTASATEINLLDGVTSTTAELNILDGVTATAAELNVLDGVTAFVDEDDMVSNSATAIPSQQSVKAYVDSTVTAQDLDFQGDSGGALSIDLDSETLTIAGGTGIDTSGATNTLTVAIDSTVATLTGSQTLTNKTLTTPVISSISNTGTLTLPTSTDTLVGRDTTDTLTNKTLTSPVLNTGVSGTAILDEDDMVSDSATQLATQQSIKAYVDSQVASADTLAELTDTNITTPADGALLFYDTTTSKWIDNVVSGDITIADTGVAAIGSGVIVNDDINASAAISVSKTALTAGTGLTLTTDTLSVDASQTQITAVGTIGTGTWQGSVITNTYVADDLTINGGTIENTPIGAATPNTGEFTTLSATGDLTVTGDVVISEATPSITLDDADNADGELQIVQSSGSSFYRTRGVTANGAHVFQRNDGTTILKIFQTNTSGDVIFYDDDGSTDGMRWDASTSRLGIGTDSPAEILHVSDTSTAGAVGLRAENSEGHVNFTTNGGGFQFETGASGVVATIDSSGNVGIGTTSTSGVQGLLHIHSSSDDNGDGDGQVNFGDESTVIISTNGTSAGGQGYYGSLFFGGQDLSSETQQVWRLAGLSAYSSTDLGTTGSADLLFYTTSSASTPSERMRINSSGDLLVGNTLGPLGLISTTTTEGFGIDASETYVAISRSNNGSALYLNKPGESTATAGDFIQCRQNGTVVGDIDYDGADLVITQASDERLKNNIADSASAGSIIDAMQVRSFDWNNGVHVDYGFVAQELHQAYEPAAKVGGDDVDDEPWGIKTQKLIPLLVKEIQDLRARVAQLEGE
jgi:hypothetical protein